MKAIIVEDEYLSLEELKELIEKNSDIEVVKTFENGVDTLKFINKNHVDIIFLDINIPLLNGMELVRILNNFEKKPKVVLITAYSEYAVEAFELDVFDYIMKPYMEERIISMLNKLEIACKQEKIPEVSPNETKITLKEKNGLIVLNTDDIYMCEADDKETYIYTKNQKYVIKECISDIYNGLPQDKFFKCHRSYVVNLSEITKVIPVENSKYKLMFKDESLECWVSRSNIKEFRDLMNMS